jgi:hypothetical protein
VLSRTVFLDQAMHADRAVLGCDEAVAVQRVERVAEAFGVRWVVGVVEQACEQCLGDRVGRQMRGDRQDVLGQRRSVGRGGDRGSPRRRDRLRIKHLGAAVKHDGGGQVGQHRQVLGERRAGLAVGGGVREGKRQAAQCGGQAPCCCVVLVTVGLLKQVAGRGVLVKDVDGEQRGVLAQTVVA